MRVRLLVAVATAHGATRVVGERIAHTIGQSLGLHGLVVEIDVMDADEVRGVDWYDAVVLGSAVQAGRWLPAAERFVGANVDALRERPVWVFSSGPLGVPPASSKEPFEPARTADRIGARSHRVFAGIGAPDGEFRGWHLVDDWATEVATELASLHGRRVVMSS